MGNINTLNVPLKAEACLRRLLMKEQSLGYTPHQRDTYWLSQDRSLPTRTYDLLCINTFLFISLLYLEAYSPLIKINRCVLVTFLMVVTKHVTHLPSGRRVWFWLIVRGIGHHGDGGVVDVLTPSMVVGVWCSWSHCGGQRKQRGHRSTAGLSSSRSHPSLWCCIC